MQKVKIEITDLNSAGEGVGRLASGKVIFIPYALPGEKVTAVVAEEKKNRARGHLEDILFLSPYRREPPCPLFYFCGGCALQHLDYEQQLEWKRMNVRESLARLGKVHDVQVQPVLGAPSPFHYRNKITLHWRQQQNKKTLLGFYSLGSHEPVETKHCLLAAKPINDALKALHEMLDGVELSGEAKTGKKQITLRHTLSRDEIMLVFSTPEGAERGLLQKIPELKEKIPALASIWHFSGKQALHRWGQRQLQEQLLHCTFSLGPQAFFQVNPQQAARLFHEALKRLDQAPYLKGLADLHCGTGVMALLAADRAEQVYGMDSFGPAVEDARSNARANGIDHANFLKGTAEKVLPELLHSSTVEAALLNPPRQGCSQALLNTLTRAGIPRLIYISCNPATLSRDLQHFTAQGYQAGPVQPVDMFPQTPHVECVVLISRV